jgi:hypothetical protein
MGSRVRVPPRSPILSLQDNGFLRRGPATRMRAGTNKRTKGTNFYSCAVLALVGRRASIPSDLRRRQLVAPWSPRIIHVPLSGGDRKAQAKGIRYAHGIHASQYRESVPIRSAAEAKIREADRLECEAWNAIIWAGGPAMPSPGDPQAEPTIGKAISGGFDLLDAMCNRCDWISLLPLRALRQPPEAPVCPTGPLMCDRKTSNDENLTRSGSGDSRSRGSNCWGGYPYSRP